MPPTSATLNIGLPKFIDQVYTDARLHSAIDYLTPIEFENATLGERHIPIPPFKDRGFPPVHGADVSYRRARRRCRARVASSDYRGLRTR